MDAAGIEGQPKRVKDLASKFWGRIDEERAAIKQAFHQWKINHSKRARPIVETSTTQ
jgi:hypothetical protein